ncbi:receptor like protein kinase S.2 [Impatiens glandulifera]|uniref:receptor like protein kinase S.2 n=1 Tax=Impatiens glandulifera TaxID=253017 RepID=UPI001FB060CF|nr:receptor like protein kinase S.2 [Impatiens glandulifera]
MQLSRLCFVLPPPDFDDDHNHHNDIESPKPISKPPTSHHRRHCGGELFSTIRSSLASCFRHSNNSQFSGAFHDTAGTGFSEKVGAGIGNPKIFSYAELYIGSDGFSEDELLGSGGFGRVYRAVLPSDGTIAAVKCLAEKGERFEKTFEAELAAVAHLRHRNLVRLRGWCVHEDQLLLVYDYMPNLSLDRILFRRPEKGGSAPVLNWERRRNIINGLAAALFYLHEELETQIIHRDVKTSNVMLDSHYNARLGDFGLARWLEHELVYKNRVNPSLKHQRFHLSETTKIGGTIGYLPPESFQKKSTATAKSDVFSFGIVLMEVVSGRRAVDLSFSDDQIVLLDWIRRLSDEGRLLQAGDSRIVDGSYRLSDMERFLQVGLLCTVQNPFSRPNMKWVIEAISGKMYGKLPAVPSFKTQPLYITLTSSDSSDSSSGTTTTTTKTSSNSISLTKSSNFLTANGESTIYLTADYSGSLTEPEQSFRKQQQQPSPFMIVDTPNEIPFNKLVTATNNFSDSNRVAEIDFGTAYYGFLSKNKQHVLVKRLGMKTCPALRARFSNELRNLTRLRHRNLVQLRGWCTEQGEMLVIYDYSAKRLLSNLLFQNQTGKATHSSSPLRWHHRYNIVKSLASAIRYLHEEWDEQVIHKCITTSAIVLDHDMNPRLGSFALAEFLARKEHGNGNGHHVPIDTKRSVRGIFGYMSPEYMESGEATPMADIYSFGVVLLEMVTGQTAVDFRRPEVFLVSRMLKFEENEFYDNLVDMRLNGVYDRFELSRLVKLGIACIRSEAKSRPTIGQITNILDGNDECLMEFGKRKESRAEWREKYASAITLVRRIQALGIQ